MVVLVQVAALVQVLAAPTPEPDRAALSAAPAARDRVALAVAQQAARPRRVTAERIRAGTTLGLCPAAAPVVAPRSTA